MVAIACLCAEHTVLGSLHHEVGDPNQDCTLAYTKPYQYTVLGVFDGHGPAGQLAAELAKTTALSALTEETIEMAEAPEEALRQIFEMIAAAADEATWSQQSGCTGTLAFVSLASGGIWVANIGDSDAVLVPAVGDAFKITQTHRLSNDEEFNRVKGMTDAVVEKEYLVSRSNQASCMNVTRSFGDKDMRDAGVCAIPAVWKGSICGENNDIGRTDFLLLATDGLWDQGLHAESVAQVIEEIEDSPDFLQQCCTELVATAGGARIADDVSLVMAAFQRMSG